MHAVSRRVVVVLAVVYACAWLLVGCGGPGPRSSATPSEQTGAQEKAPSQPQAQPLTEENGVVVDLTDPSNYGRTWVTRAKECEVKSNSDGSLVCTVTGDGSAARGGRYGGVKIKTGDPLKAVALQVAFSHPENIVGAFLDLTAASKPKPRLRWQFFPSRATPVPSGEQSFTFRTNHATGVFGYVGGDANPDKVDTVRFFLRVKPGKQAGFRISRVVVEK